MITVQRQELVKVMGHFTLNNQDRIQAESGKMSCVEKGSLPLTEGTTGAKAQGAKTSFVGGAE